MKKSGWVLSLVLALVAVLGLALAAQEKAGKEGEKAPAMDPQMQAMMEAYAKAAEVNENHKFLAQMVGDWKVTGKAWMGPGEPTESEGVAKITAILGGRFVKQEFKGNFQGNPFEGIGISGYDNTLKKFTGIWVDSMGTGIMTGQGTLDATGKVLTMMDSYPDPLTGQVKTTRDVTTIVGKDKYVAEFYDKGPDGKEFRMMEITYTRIAEAPKK